MIHFLIICYSSQLENQKKKRREERNGEGKHNTRRLDKYINTDGKEREEGREEEGCEGKRSEKMEKQKRKREK